MRDLKKKEDIEIQTFITAMQNEIVKSFLDSDQKLDYKSVWVKRIQTCASDLEVTLVSTRD